MISSYIIQQSKCECCSYLCTKFTQTLADSKTIDTKNLGGWWKVVFFFSQPAEPYVNILGFKTAICACFCEDRVQNTYDAWRGKQGASRILCHTLGSLFIVACSWIFCCCFLSFSDMIWNVLMWVCIGLTCEAVAKTKTGEKSPPRHERLMRICPLETTEQQHNTSHVCNVPSLDWARHGFKPKN